MDREAHNVYVLIHTKIAEDFQDLCQILSTVEKLKALVRPEARHQAEKLHDQILTEARKMIQAHGRSKKNSPT